MFKKYCAKDDVEARLIGKLTKAVSLPSNGEANLAIDSIWIVIYASKALREEQEHYMGRNRKEKTSKR